MPILDSKVQAELETDIFSYPETSDESAVIDSVQTQEGDSPNQRDITLGDLHANAIKFLYFLFRNKIIKFKDEFEKKTEYQNLVQLYESIRFTPKIAKELESRERKNGQLYSDEYKDPLIDFRTVFTDFQSILEKIEVINTDIAIRLIGDEFADRGVNDYFNLMIFKYLKEKSVNITTLMSNHGIEFFQFYLQTKYKLSKSPQTQQQFLGSLEINSYIANSKPSLYAFKYALQKGDIDINSFIEIVEQCYLPTLKLLDYNLAEDGSIQLFTHAPIRFDAIEYLVAKINDLNPNANLQYKDNTPQDLAQTIDTINAHFKKFISDGRFSELFTIDDDDRYLVFESFTNEIDTEENKRLIKKYPFIYLTWNRWSQTRDNTFFDFRYWSVRLSRPPQHPKYGYKIFYINGHDGFNSTHSHVINVDSEIGKLDYYSLRDIESEPQEKERYAKSSLWSYREFNTIKIRPNTRTLNESKKSAFNENQTKSIARKLGLLTASVFTLGLVLGIALVIGGITAPIGAGILGSIALGAILGGIMGLITALGATRLAKMSKEKNEHQDKNVTFDKLRQVSSGNNLGETIDEKHKYAQIFTKTKQHQPEQPAEEKMQKDDEIEEKSPDFKP